MKKRNNFKIYFFALFLIYILILVDGSISFIAHFFSAVVAGKIFWLGSLCVLTVLSFEINVNFLGIAVVSGIIADIFYSGIIGIYTVSFAITAIFLKWIVQYLPHNFIYIISSYFLSVTIFSTIYYGINNYLGLTRIAPFQYLATYLPATLLFNLIYFIILYVPMLKIIENFKRKLALKDEK